ncbi:GAF domain-containing protein [Kordiimonas lacus]|uniref:GAF domain-containing protein n=1 Tax=Kordiimonas lacus TaxID=637679 RepID=A0A1G6YPZ4_9PROT|nr:GAF domain-containing protein [Kordiimonas lacus]SDD92469.1 GAF domain-containing protein [Kordiimonas lacus]
MVSKQEQYELVVEQVRAVLEGETNVTAKMATVACLLAGAFPETYFWTGFYVVDPEKDRELIVGPYQGTLGCLRIPFGKGVCGAAAATGETQVVADVHAFPGHIACDSRSNSEIVVPVWNKAGELIAVLDVDSTQHGSFDETDKQYLEGLMADIFAA